MKSKLQHYGQPAESAAPGKENDQVAEEIQMFLRAVDSYPERFAKEPSLSFHRHLAHFFEALHAGPERH